MERSRRAGRKGHFSQERAALTLFDLSPRSPELTGSFRHRPLGALIVLTLEGEGSGGAAPGEVRDGVGMMGAASGV